jgi:mono/diheme cytochrome c family protein
MRAFMRMFTRCRSRGAACVFAVLVLNSALRVARADEGVCVTFQHETLTDARIARLIALAVPQGTSPTPLLPPGPFTATFAGEINLKLRGECTFTAQGRGAIEITVNGEPALSARGDDLAQQPGKPVKLKKGPNAIVAKYSALESGDAELRLYWAERKSPLEPVSPLVLTHDPSVGGLIKAQMFRMGRELATTERCIRCHTPPVGPLQRVASTASSTDESMPELALDAPNLDDVGSRLRPEWLAHWISDPRSLRPDATMPQLFHAPADPAHPSGGQPDARARDITAYLATRKAANPLPDPAPPSSELIGKGTRLFTGLGCIGCHTAPDQTDAGTLAANRVPLRYVKAKYQPAALREFLLAPAKRYVWIRMPDFHLSAGEADALTAFLLSRGSDDSLPATELKSADPKRGEQLFQSAGCVNCHAPTQVSALHAPPLEQVRKSDLKRGCVAESLADHGGAPDFGFTQSQLEAVRAFAGTDWQSLLHDSPVEFAERQVRQLNCTACHTRDNTVDAWTNLSQEVQALEASLPPEPKDPKSTVGGDQQRPVLTWVGDKLKPDWMAQFIAGKVDYKPRPWLMARMPSFASRAQKLAEGLSIQHGWPLTIAGEPPADPRLVAIGRRLIGRNQGFSCNQCHPVGTSPALVPFDSPAPNFSHTFERMRKDYYHRWVRSPQKYQPGTRMPQYADTEGKTSYKDVLGGDAGQQFEAIWQYLREGRAIDPPE